MLSIFKRSGLKPSADQATYEEITPKTARVWMLTPTRGEREFTVNFSVDEIEDLLRGEDERRQSTPEDGNVTDSEIAEANREHLAKFRDWKPGDPVE